MGVPAEVCGGVGGGGDLDPKQRAPPGTTRSLQEMRRELSDHLSQPGVQALTLKYQRCLESLCGELLAPKE